MIPPPGPQQPESLVPLLEATDLVGRVVAFEEIEQTLEDPHAFLAARAWDAAAWGPIPRVALPSKARGRGRRGHAR